MPKIPDISSYFSYKGIRKDIPQELKNKIISLEPRASFQLRHDGSGSIKTLQNRIYAYFNRQGIKQEYKIHIDEHILTIKRLGDEFTILDSALPLNRVENFILDTLLDIETQEEALQAIELAVSKKTLTDSDIIPAIKEWRRIQGKADTSKEAETKSEIKSQSQFQLVNPDIEKLF